MAVTPDQLLIATRKLLPNIEKFWIDDHPLNKMLFDKMKREVIPGPYVAFDVEVDGVGTTTQLKTGNEIINAPRRNILRQGRVDVPTMIYAFSVNGQQLRKSSGDAGIVNLLKLYPENAATHFRTGLGIHFICGRHADTVEGGASIGNVDQVFHLNGDKNWQVDSSTASNTGLLQFRDKSAQTDTFLGLPRTGAATNPTPKWANQYREVTSFAAHGRARMREVYNWCEARGGTMGAPDLGFCDPTSFDNFYNSLEDQIRFEKTFEGSSGPSRKSGLKFMDITMYSEIAFYEDSAAFNHGADGTMYFLNSKSFKVICTPDISEGEINTGNSYFGLRGPTRQENRDAWMYEYLFSGQPICTRVASNGCLKGTAL